MCVSDFDCPMSQVCYRNVTWQAGSFCQCSSWYGWMDMPSCNILGPGSYLALGILLFSLVLVLVALGVALFSIVLFLSSESAARNAFLATLILDILSAIFQVGFHVFRAVSLLEPEENVVHVSSSPTTKFQAGYYGEYASFIPALFFTTCMVLNVSVVWSNVASAGKLLSQTEYSRLQRVWNKVIFLLEGILTVGVLILVCLNLDDIITLWILPFVGFIAVMVIIGSSQMYKIIKSLEGSSNAAQQSQKLEGTSKTAMKRSAVLIATTGLSLTVIATLLIIIAIIYSGLDIVGWEEFSPINGMAPMETLRSVLSLLSVGLNVMTTRYLFMVVAGPTKASRKTTSLRGEVNAIVAGSDSGKVSAVPE